MISAGHAVQPTNATPELTWQSIGNTQTGGYGAAPRLSFNFGKDSANVWKDYKKDMQTQQTWSNGIAIGEKAVNAAGQITAMALNYNIQSKYFNLQSKIADHQFDLGIRSIELETTKLDTAERMNQENNDHQKRIARIQSQTAVSIAQIKQRGTTKRAEVFAAMNAFHRTNYQYGTPTFQTGTMS